ncbi:hypothetical protein [Agrococcus sp. SGAir0287]|uniref:hypothetical protein n=1 Tax=Agrococcus sp. SGAir0287 TaxID=2070347 RepID=UPI0010FA41A0|nr:hypothetical protein [Agrococcus sp. SGAir0287]
MRIARATTALAALALLVTGCAATSSADASRADGATGADAERIPEAATPTAWIDGDTVRVDAADASWTLELLEAGPVGDDDVTMFEGDGGFELPAGDDRVGWVCVRATQLAGAAGAWLSDAVRIEVWASDAGPRYDDLTGFDYEPTGDVLDVYEAEGNALGIPYERVCPIFVVPADVDFSTIAFVPNGGEPAVLER